MEIHINDKRSSIHNAQSQELIEIENLLSYRPENYFFAPSYKAGWWDGWIKPFDRLTKSVPRGYTYFLAERFNAKVVDLRQAPKLGKKVDANMESREYQQEIIDTMLKKKFGLIKAATNSGKTDMAAAVISKTMVKTIFFVHVKELMYQTAQRLELRLGLPPGAIGVIGDSVWEERLINVAMIQTFSKNLSKTRGKKLVKSTEMVFFDEAHHLVSKQWTNIAKAFSKCYWLFGLTGTVQKEIEQLSHLMSVVGAVIASVSNKFLIDEGFSAKPTVFIHKLKTTRYDDWGIAYKHGIVNNLDRNKLIVSEIKKSVEANEPVLCIVSHAAHMKKLLDICRKEKFGVVEGIYSGSANREGIYARFKAGTTKALISTPMFDEGVDLPDIRKFVNAAGGKDFKKTLQRIGRGLRKKEGDNVLTVIDFYDDDCGYLLSHSKERISTCKGEKFSIVVVKP